MYPKSKSLCYNLKNGLDASLPFPDMFKSLGSNRKKSIPILTMLEMNKSLNGLTSFMLNKLDKCNIRRQPKYFDVGMEIDDFIDLKYFFHNICGSFAQP